MRHTFTASQFAALQGDEQGTALSQAVEAMAAPPNGEFEDLNAKILALEARYGFDSREMRSLVATGKLDESWEICEWAMLVELRDAVGSNSPRA